MDILPAIIIGDSLGFDSATAIEKVDCSSSPIMKWICSTFSTISGGLDIGAIVCNA